MGGPVALTPHDDEAPYITYQGNWVLSRNGGDWTGGAGDPYKPNGWDDTAAGTFSYTNDRNASASFKFFGSQITYFYTAAYNRDRAYVTIDGQRQYPDIEMYCAYPCVLPQQSRTYSSLAAGQEHTIVIQHSGANTCGSGACYIDVDAFGIDTVDDSDGSVAYYIGVGRANSGVSSNGGWYLSRYGDCWTGGNGDPCRSKYSNLYGGTASYTDNLFAAAEYQFFGKQITYLFTKAFNRAYVNISIDGQLKATINQYSSALEPQSGWTWTSPDGSPARHTIRITHAGYHDNSANCAVPSSTTCYFDVDAFIGSVPVTSR